jgi:hypothetical protein
MVHQAWWAELALGLGLGIVLGYVLYQVVMAWKAIRTSRRLRAQIEQRHADRYERLKRPYAFMAFALLLIPALASAQSLRSGTLQAAQSVGNGTVLEVTDYVSVSLGIIGSSGADRVVNFEGSQDGTNYVAFMCMNRATLVPALTVAATSTTPMLWICPVTGLRLFRARLSDGATGTVTITAIASGDPVPGWQLAP